MNTGKTQSLILREVNRIRGRKHALKYDKSRHEEAVRCAAKNVREGRLLHVCANGYPDIVCRLGRASNQPEARVARRAVDCWMGSPSHREYLTHGSFKKCGISVRVRGSTVYVAMVLSRGFWGI